MYTVYCILHQLGRRHSPKKSRRVLAEENCGSHPDQESHPEHEPGQWPPPTHGLEPHPQPTPLTPHLASFVFSFSVLSPCPHTSLFVTHFSQSQTHAQSCNIIGHLWTHSQSHNIIGHLSYYSYRILFIILVYQCSSSHNTIGQCLLYNLSHTAVSLFLYAVDKGLRGRNVLQSLLLILRRICSRSVRPISTK